MEEAKYKFNRDKKKSNTKKPRPVKKINISKPQETYDPLKVNQKVEKELEENKQDINKRRPEQDVSLIKQFVCLNLLCSK